MLEGIFKKEWETEWEEAGMCTTLFMLSGNIWSGFASMHAVVFVCFSNIDPCGWTISHKRFLPYYRNPPVNRSASPSSALGLGPSAASLSFSLWSRETPPLPNTKTFAVSPHLCPPQRSKQLCLHLLSPNFCHHILSITKSLCCLSFLSFLILYLLCVSALCFISLSVPGRDKSTSLHNHCTSIHFVLDAGLFCLRVSVIPAINYLVCSKQFSRESQSCHDSIFSLSSR